MSGHPIQLVKGRHRWTFRYDCPNMLRRCLNDLTNRADVPLDYFDAALIMHQAARHAAGEVAAPLHRPEGQP